jgi:hypothetical protein
MPRVAPDHRGAFVIASLSVTPPPDIKDPEERALFCFLKNNQTVSTPVERAYELYCDSEIRHVINAAILGKASDEQISDATEVSTECLPTYRRLFFDRSTFPYTPSIIRYVNNLPEPLHTLYMTAIQQGPEYLLNRYRVGARIPIDPKKTIDLVRSDCTERFLTHRGLDITSPVAKEALRWGEQAVRAASIDLNRESDIENLASSIKLALAAKEHTLTPQEAGVKPTDVL